MLEAFASETTEVNVRLEEAPRPIRDAIEQGLRKAGRGASDLLARLVGIGVVRATLVAAESKQRSQPREFITLNTGGIYGDLHNELTRLISGHDDILKFFGGQDGGDTKLNERQVSLVSTEETAAIAATLGIAPDFSMDGLQGENLVIAKCFPRGNFTAMLKSQGATRATFIRPSGVPSGVNLLLTGENHPCSWPHARIREAVGHELNGKYKSAARGRRGMTAMVLTPDDPRYGTITPGDFVAFWS